jgi:hypothetical protein
LSGGSDNRTAAAEKFAHRADAVNVYDENTFIIIDIEFNG